VVNISQFGLAKLSSLNGVYIREKIDFMELLTGCKKQNLYEVYMSDPTRTAGGFGPLQFFGQEHSSWCCRNCIEYSIINTLNKP
jgi:hypothetical protein